MAGTSVHNQCIEGLWGEVIKCVVRHFRNIFLFLENEGLLDLLNEVHLFTLHYNDMLRIKKVLKEFSKYWRYIHYLVEGISRHTNFQITV